MENKNLEVAEEHRLLAFDEIAIPEHYQIVLDEIKKRSLRVTPAGFFDGSNQKINLYNGDKPYITRLRQKVYLSRVYDYLLGRPSNDKSRSAISRYVADFETTTDPNGVWVWAWSLQNIDIPEACIYGTSIDDFFETIKKIKHGTVYFHNYAWDIEFQFPYLLNEAGYKPLKSRKGKREGVFASHIIETYVYSLSYVLGTSKAHNRRISEITFIDSLKGLPMSVEELGEEFRDEIIATYGIDYGKLTKDDEFFNIERSKDHILTDEEIDYVIQDSRIVAAALKVKFEMGLERNTLAGDAMADFKMLHAEGESEKNLQDKIFRKTFPKLPRSQSEFIMLSYKGGLVQVNPEHKEKDLGKTVMYDVNSTYSYAMKNQLMPYDEPLVFTGSYDDLTEKEKKDYPLYIVEVVAEAFLNEGCIPTLQKPGLSKVFGAKYFIDTDDGPRNFILTNVDLERAKQNYDFIPDHYVGGLAFKGKVGMFDSFIDKWIAQKQYYEQPETYSKGRRKISKLILNSLYGQFAMSWEKNKKYPKIVNGITKLIPVEKYEELDDTIEEHRLKKDKIHDDLIVYPAVACFTTSYAREYLIQVIQANFHRFVYCDTDSVSLLGWEEPLGMMIDKDKSGDLGKWKHEYDSDYGRYLRPKTYCNYYHKKGNPEKKLHVVVGAMKKSASKKFTWETFHVWNGIYPNGHDGKPDISAGEVEVGVGIAYGQKKRKRTKGGLYLETRWGVILPDLED